MGTNNFIVYIKTGNIYEYIGEDVETKYDASNYELDRPLSVITIIIKSNRINER